MIGTFGKIIFQTSSNKVLTFDGFTRKGSAEFAEHPVLGEKPTLQHTGNGLDEITFSVRLDAGLGVNPVEAVEMFRSARAAGDSENLIIGGRVLGRFVIKELEDRWPKITGNGVPLVINVDLTLREFVDGN
jgi:phage protein U